MHITFGHRLPERNAGGGLGSALVSDLHAHPTTQSTFHSPLVPHQFRKTGLAWPPQQSGRSSYPANPAQHVVHKSTHTCQYASHMVPKPIMKASLLSSPWRTMRGRHPGKLQLCSVTASHSFWRDKCYTHRDNAPSVMERTWSWAVTLRQQTGSRHRVVSPALPSSGQLREWSRQQALARQPIWQRMSWRTWQPTS